MDLLKRFKAAKVDLVLFPECSLSGFTSKMKECTSEVLLPYFDQLQVWSAQEGIEIILPTALVENGRVYNSGKWFCGRESDFFFKLGLTASEQKFFSAPDDAHSKIVEVRGFRFAILICFEAEHEPWTYFREGDVDAVLWPGYWGWTIDDQWGVLREPEKPNPIFKNLQHWKMPLLQSNFAFNDLDGHSSAGPEGLSVVINAENEVVGRGPHKEVGGLVVELMKYSTCTLVSDCSLLPSSDINKPVISVP